MREMTKTEQGREQRRKEAEQRAAERKARRAASAKRQRNADIRTYGAGSMTFGNIYDVETGKYDPGFNKEGTDETISNDGIDQLESEAEGGGGIPAGYDEVEVIIVQDGEPVTGEILFKEE